MNMQKIPMDKIHEETLDEDRLYDVYMSKHYNQFNKKRFPFLYTAEERDSEIQVDYKKLKMPHFDRVTMPDAIKKLQEEAAKLEPQP